MSKVTEDVNKVSNMLNSMGFNPEEFCEEFTKEHRTIQQNFTRLCIHWICTCASDDYRYDGRNEASHSIAKAIVESQDPDFLGNIPFI